MTSETEVARPNVLLALSWADLVFVVMLWFSNTWVAERTVLTTTLCYSPQYIFATPAAILALFGLVRRNLSAILVTAVAMLILIAGPMGLCVGRTRAADGPRFRIATFNIKAGRMGMVRVTAAARSLDADVLCFQEAYDPIPAQNLGARLGSGLPGYRIVEAGSLVTASRLPVGTIRDLPLLADGKALRRILLTEVTVGGRRCTVANVHFVLARGGRSPSVLPTFVQDAGPARLEQVDRVLAALGPATDSVVLCGDLNTPPRGLAFRRLRGFFQDSWAQTAFGFGHTFTASMPALRIDHVLAGSGFTPIRSRVARVRASDHLPLVVNLAVR